MRVSDGDALAVWAAVWPVLRAHEHERSWDATYNAVLQGACTGLLEWAARRTSPPTDADYDALVRVLQGVAARAADHAHGALP